MRTFENNVEFENSETNLIQPLKTYWISQIKLKSCTESGPPTNETRPPGEGFRLKLMSVFKAS